MTSNNDASRRAGELTGTLPARPAAGRHAAAPRTASGGRDGAFRTQQIPAQAAAETLEDSARDPFEPSTPDPAATRASRPSRTGVQTAAPRGAHGRAPRPEAASQTGMIPNLSTTLPEVTAADVEQQPVGAPVITFDHVTKVYPAQPNRPSLHDISLQIYAGEFVFLVGHSGSGKSTFIKLITRELKPTDGKIYIGNEDLTAMRDWRVPYLRRNIGCVFQDFKLLPNKTVYENVAFALQVIGKSNHVIKTQVPEVLRLVGLQDKLSKRPDQLSGGEQQRVSIARAIVNRPPLLVCDEPTGNLDPQTSRGIMDLLERINRTGTTVLVATHDREMVDNMRRRVIALDGGQLTRDQDRGVYGFDV